MCARDFFSEASGRNAAEVQGGTTSRRGAANNVRNKLGFIQPENGE